MEETNFEQVKTDVHRTLLSQLDLEKLSAISNGRARNAVATLIQEILSSYTEHWMIFTGAIFVLMVIFLPGGLVGTARRWIEGRA